jgi:hypothetical protein
MLFERINVRGRGERERERVESGEWRVESGGRKQLVWFGGRSKGTLVPYPYPVLINKRCYVARGRGNGRLERTTITNACVRNQNLCIKLGATYSLRVGPIICMWGRAKERAFIVKRASHNVVSILSLLCYRCDFM